MSFTSKCIGIAKKAKHACTDRLRARTPVYLSPVRRIERVAATARVCAMTFDDGPCRLPANPDHWGGKPLTLVLAETLERHGARASFDVVGDTAENYPDRPGKEGTAAWGGVAYDHYPDFGKDGEGGVAHCPELISRLLEGGHELTSHTWRHRLWGRKNVIYGRRKHLCGLNDVTEDLQTMHRALQDGWGYTVRLSRPPHYVDRIAGGFCSYDAYALMGYQYMAADFDGAGWLPLASYEAEVAAMVEPMKRLLAQNPDALCGQIIFQKDGFNMARRSPVANGLELQLQLLDSYGYRVIPVSELMEQAPFRDLPLSEPVAAAAAALLERGWCPVFRDNTLRPDTVLTRGALAEMAFGAEGAKERIRLIKEKRPPFADMKAAHPYAGAAALAAAARVMEAPGGRFSPGAPASGRDIRSVLRYKTGKEPPREPAPPCSHGALIRMAAEGYGAL